MQFHIGKYVPPLGVPTPLAPVLTPPFSTYFGVIYGKYYLLSITLSFRPDKGMFDLALQKLVFDGINSVEVIQEVIYL